MWTRQDPQPSAAMPGGNPSPPSLGGRPDSNVARRLLAWPRWVGVMAITGISILASDVMTFVIAGLALPEPHYPVALTIATLMPLVIATPVSWVLIGLFHELDDARAEALRLARTDLLTGALNRRRFVEVAERELARANIDDRSVSLVLLDIDNFKHINDRHGHRVGDDVIRLVAEVCADVLRPSDHLGRWGGEEFVALLPGAAIADALVIAERLRRSLSREHALGRDESLRISASFGVASTDLGVRALDRLVALADQAMYRVKRSGKDSVLAADPVNRAA
jgi:diguanylate cyclase (GGDEF)-like protein